MIEKTADIVLIWKPVFFIIKKIMQEKSDKKTRSKNKTLDNKKHTIKNITIKILPIKLSQTFRRIMYHTNKGIK